MIFLADLLIDADAALHAERRMKVGIDIVEGGNGRRGIRRVHGGAGAFGL